MAMTAATLVALALLAFCQPARAYDMGGEGPLTGEANKGGADGDASGVEAVSAEEPSPAPLPPESRDLTVRARVAQVRLTYYTEYGVTFSGVRTGPGQTACSSNFPLWSRFRFDNGETFVCTDRGRLGSTGWLDLWRRADLARVYGNYALVEVLP
jgi:hypothetical protein